ncbi:hypothetical protein D3C81_1529980 [compost metagenome]
MVPACAICCASKAAVFGPISRIMSSSATSATSLTVAAAVGANSFAQTTSTGIGTDAPRLAIMSMIALASPTRSASASDLPIFKPAASMKVFAIPPPTIRLSTLSANVFRMVNLVDTLEPATIATSGLAGSPRALPNASSSAASKGPAQATAAYLAIPWVVASARWAVPNASFT